MGVFIFVAFYLVKKRKDAETWTIGMAFLFIYLHSLFDFDLSFGFMALVAWTLLGLFNHKIKNAGGVFQERKIPKLAAQRFLLLYFLLLISLTISLGYSSTIGEKEGYDQTRAKLEKAIILYPLNAENYASLGNTHYGAYFRTRNPQYLVKAVEMSEQALNKGYNNYSWFMLKAKCLIAQGELDSVLRVLEEGRPYMGKFENNIYTRTADFYRQVAEKAGKQKKTPLVRRAYEEMIVLWEQAQAEMATVDPRFLNKWAEEETLVQFDDFLIEVIHAYIELGELERAGELLPELSAQTFNKNPWLKVIE
jgi:tetratricopeptide (TPR) repeat protein